MLGQEWGKAATVAGGAVGMSAAFFTSSMVSVLAWGSLFLLLAGEDSSNVKARICRT